MISYYKIINVVGFDMIQTCETSHSNIDEALDNIPIKEEYTHLLIKTNETEELIPIQRILKLGQL